MAYWNLKLTRTVSSVEYPSAFLKVIPENSRLAWLWPPHQLPAFKGVPLRMDSSHLSDDGQIDRFKPILSGRSGNWSPIAIIHGCQPWSKTNLWSCSRQATMCPPYRPLLKQPPLSDFFTPIYYTMRFPILGLRNFLGSKSLLSRSSWLSWQPGSPCDCGGGGV